MTSDGDTLQEQIDYYRARAPEYDEWFLRLGRYDKGEALNRLWFDEIGEVAQALEDFSPAGNVLELACGTGWWTERLARHAGHMTAVDSSPEALALNRARLGSDDIEYVQADLFAWRPMRAYDVVFFSFWLSHVPPEQFAAFWAMVRGALAPGGRVFFIDSLLNPTGSAANQSFGDVEETRQVRKLNDGRAFTIYKVYYDPATLPARLGDLGWDVGVRQTANYFLYGRGSPQVRWQG
ncbi:MAG: methyltransferase domain-containing protein [Anaerolineae bacterium]